MQAVEKSPITPSGLNSPGDQDRLAERMALWIRAWEEKRRIIEPRWDRIDKQLAGKPETPKEMPWDGFSYRNIPMLPAKSQAWEAYVCNAPTSTTPYLIGTIFGKNAARAKDIEQDFYLLMRQGEWARVFRQVTHSMGAYGKGIWRVRPALDDYGRIIFEYKNVPMRKFFIYPDIPEGIRAAKVVGHTFELRVSEVEEMQEKGGLWADVRITGKKQISDNPTPIGAVDNRQSIAKEPEDFPVRIAEVFFKYAFGDDEYPKWYRAWLAMDEKRLLAIWDYPYSRPWYFDQFVHEEEASFLPEGSRFNDAQDLQLAINEIWNQMSAGAQMGAFPTVFSNGWALPQKYAKTKPGQVVPTTGTGQISQLQSRFDASVMPVLLNDLYKKASEIFRLDEQQLGVKTSGDQTATAAQIRQGGAQTAITDDLSNIDVCQSQIGTFQQELYRTHYADFLEAYGEDLACQPDPQDEGTVERGFPAILGKPIQWELMGKSPDSTPMAQSQAAMQMFTAMGQIANPQAVQTLLAMGINVAAIMQEIVSNSTLENRNAILVNPGYSGEDPQQSMQAMQQMAQTISQQNAPKPQPTHPSESIAYKDCSPFIQAQMEKQAGFQPDPSHQQGLPHPGSDQHSNLMEMAHSVIKSHKDNQKEQQKQIEEASKNMPPQSPGAIPQAPPQLGQQAPAQPNI